VQQFAGSATFSGAVNNYSGDGTLTLPVQQLAGDAYFIEPVYAGGGALTLPAQQLAGEAVFIKPVYSGDGTLTLPVQQLAADASFVNPVYTGDAALTLPAQQLASEAVFIKPVYTGNAAIALPLQRVRGRSGNLPDIVLRNNETTLSVSWAEDNLEHTITESVNYISPTITGDAAVVLHTTSRTSRKESSTIIASRR
jgi:hypothetical protein